MNVAITFDAWRKCNIITNHAIMLNITSDIAVKVNPDTNVTRNRGERRKYRSLTDHDIFHGDMLFCHNRIELKTIRHATLGKPLPDQAVSNCYRHSLFRSL